MTALSNQMHDKMTVRLNELRQKVIGQMTSTGERIKQRPSLPGDTALKTISNHDVMKQNDDGFQILSAAIGIPGVSETVGTMIDVGIDLYADRKATHQRPQDTLDLSPKQQREIREKNEDDLKTFMALEEKLIFLEGAIASGDEVGKLSPDSEFPLTFTEEEALKQGLTVPKADIKSGNEKLKPSDEFIAYHASRQTNKFSGMTIKH